MNNADLDLKALQDDKSLNEIIEIVRIAKETEEAIHCLEDKNRPIIDMKNFGDEIKILHYAV